MRESRVAKELKAVTTALGCLCDKWESPKRRGPPDYIISPPGIPVEFVETKAPKGSVKAHQTRDHTRRRCRGHRVTVVHTLEQVWAYGKDLAARIRAASGVTLH